ncbi:hypothetical protein [Nonomuraea sp. NPDC005692]|uniref:hypothetical protein n=1 Tax=Nonomuraea sp. NPDC005692 TaxID=3157168 RepID=UPI0033DA879D
MFATKHGSPIERTEDWKIWKSILQQAGVQEVGFTTLATPPRQSSSSKVRTSGSFSKCSATPE